MTAHGYNTIVPLRRGELAFLLPSIKLVYRVASLDYSFIP
jgi:hypothetical protein